MPAMIQPITSTASTISVRAAQVLTGGSPMLPPRYGSST